MIDILIFIFTYLPDLIVHIILGVGIAGFIAAFFMGGYLSKYFPSIKSNVIKYISIVIISLGLFMEGGLAVNNSYIQKAKEWSGKIELAEEKAKLVNQRIEYVYVDRIKEVEKVQFIVKEKIKKVADTIDGKCKVTREAVDILNEAAK